jgi:hypothetical protein
MPLSFLESALSATRSIAYDVQHDTSKKEGFKEVAEPSEAGLVPLRGLSALLFLGGIVYAMLSGNWGIGAIAFRPWCCGARAGPASRPAEPVRALHRGVLVLCGALTVMFIAIRMALSVT